MLGSEHPEVATSLDGLAVLYVEQGKYGEAEPLYQRALDIRKQQLGSEHSLVAEDMHGIAQIWEAQGKSEEARAWYVRTLAVREHALGSHHLKTTETRTRQHYAGSHGQSVCGDASYSTACTQNGGG